MKENLLENHQDYINKIVNLFKEDDEITYNDM